MTLNPEPARTAVDNRAVRMPSRPQSPSAVDTALAKAPRSAGNPSLAGRCREAGGSRQPRSADAAEPEQRGRSHQSRQRPLAGPAPWGLCDFHRPGRTDGDGLVSRSLCRDWRGRLRADGSVAHRCHR